MRRRLRSISVAGAMALVASTIGLGGRGDDAHTDRRGHQGHGPRDGNGTQAPAHDYSFTPAAVPPATL